MEAAKNNKKNGFSIGEKQSTGQAAVNTWRRQKNIKMEIIIHSKRDTNGNERQTTQTLNPKP